MILYPGLLDGFFDNWPFKSFHGMSLNITETALLILKYYIKVGVNKVKILKKGN